MFNSKLDKFMCFLFLMMNFAYYGFKYGVPAALPFAACAILSIGLAVKENSND